MLLKPASDIAVAICYALQPHCDRINIAGSIRRKKPEVKDIEICAIAKRTPQGQPSMFAAADVPLVVSNDFWIAVVKLGRVLKGKPDGRYMQIALPEGINLDLFLPEPADYYRQYAIRTGSADYSAKVIAGAWTRKGWCGTKDGLRRQQDCYRRELTGGKHEWVPAAGAQLPPAWESEEAFFAWLGLEWVHPIQRNL